MADAVVNYLNAVGIRVKMRPIGNERWFAVFTNIATLLKSQYAKLGAEAKVDVKDEVAWMAEMVGKLRCTWDQSVEDLLALITVHNNNFATESTSAWNNIVCHKDTNVDEYYRRMKLAADETERQRLAEELQRYLTEHMYWVSVSGSPRYKVHRKPVKDFHFQAEFKFLLERVWLDK